MSDHAAAGREPEQPVRLLFASNHVLLRDLAAVRFAAIQRIELVGSTGFDDSPLALMSRLKPDVALLAPNLGASCTAEMEIVGSVLAAARDARIIILAAAFLPGQVALLSQSGVNGFLLESQDWQTLVEAIFAVRRGSFVASPTIARSVLGTKLLAQNGLTVTEAQMMELVSQGMPNRAIAARLHVSESTVRSRLSKILMKLDVANRTQAVTESIRRGYVSLNR